MLDILPVKSPHGLRHPLMKMLSVAVPAFASIACTSAPHPTSSAPAGSAASERSLSSVIVPSAPPATVPPIINTMSASVPAPSDLSPQPRVTVDSTDMSFPLRFATSISEHGDLIAGIVAITEGSEHFFPTWLRIKKVNPDKTEHLIDLIGGDLMTSLLIHCRDPLVRCAHLRELDERADAANVVLAEYRWRVFPCYRDIGPTRSERLGPECKKFRDAEVKYENPRLRVTYRGRTLVDQLCPTWAYRGRLCTESWTTDAGPMAFDPGTGILLLWTTSYSLASEVCDVPPDDFHALRVPALRGEALPDQDGRAP